MKLWNLGLLALPLTALADTDLPRHDDLVEVVSVAAPLRQALPDPQLGGKAPQVGWVKPGETARVLDSRQYLGVFGIEVWLEVQKVEDPQAHGWVYDGLGKEIVQGKGNMAVTHRPDGSKPESRPALEDTAARRSDSLVEEILVEP